MRTRNKVILVLAIIGAIIILLITAKAISDNTWRTYTPPAIEAPSDVKIEFEETKITAASDAVLPKEAAPEVTTEPAPPASPSAPTNIPADPPVSTYQVVPYTPFYQVPIAQPQYPLTAPQPPLSQPIVPSPVQPLPPVVPKPVEGLIAPLAPVTDPLLGTVKDTLPPLPKTIEVEIELKIDE
jgi:hypothetical protein